MPKVFINDLKLFVVHNEPLQDHLFVICQKLSFLGYLLKIIMIIKVAFKTAIFYYITEYLFNYLKWSMHVW